MERCDAHLIYLIVEHIDKEVKALRSNLTANLTETAHGSDAGQSNRHRVIFEHEQQDSGHLR